MPASAFFSIITSLGATPQNKGAKMAPTNRQKELFKKLAPILGIDTRVVGYGDDEGKNSIDILSCLDPTDAEVMFYSTIGLSEREIDGRRYEILMSGRCEFDFVPSILSTCAFFVIKDGWKCACGNTFDTLVQMYHPNKEMKHILFTEPYLWEDKLHGFTACGEAV